MALSLAEVRALSRDEVEKRYDGIAKNTGDSLNFWRDEVTRRDQDERMLAMLKLTRWITIMTCVMTAATVVNVVLFALSV